MTAFVCMPAEWDEAMQQAAWDSAHLDKGGRARGKLGTGRSVQVTQVLQHGRLDELQLLAGVGVLHVADADAQAVRVHVVVVVAQRFGREAAPAHSGLASDAMA